VPVHPKQVGWADILLQPPVLEECPVSKHTTVGEAQLQHTSMTPSAKGTH
jgi:hypothetical protein